MHFDIDSQCKAKNYRVSRKAVFQLNLRHSRSFGTPRQRTCAWRWRPRSLSTPTACPRSWAASATGCSLPRPAIGNVVLRLQKALLRNKVYSKVHQGSFQNLILAFCICKRAVLREKEKVKSKPFCKFPEACFVSRLFTAKTSDRYSYIITYQSVQKRC